MLSEFCQGISSPEQVDLTRAAELIRSRVTPLFTQFKKGNPSHGS